MIKNNNTNIIKYVVALVALTGVFNKSVVAASRQPDDKQTQNAFFEIMRKSYPKKKAESIIASQLDINAYPRDPNWVYFPSLTESELDEIDRKQAVRIQGFETREEFSPEEIEAILKEAEAHSSTPPLIHKKDQQNMTVAASGEVKSAALKSRKCRRPSGPKTPFICPLCHQQCSRLDSLNRHIQTKHFCAIPIPTKTYAPIHKQQKSEQFVCKYCDATVNRRDCLNHIARTCPRANASTTEEENEKKQ